MTPAQKFLLGDTIKALPLAAREKVAVAEKVRFSENLNKLFQKGDVVFENNNQKLFDDTEPLSRPEMTTIPHTQIIFKELNEGKLPNQLKFSSGGSSGGGSELKIHPKEKIGTLNESNNAFLEYLTTNYAREILAKNKMKIYLETGSIYYNNINMQESIYEFILAQQYKPQRFMDYEINLLDNFDFYLNEIIAPITNDKDDMDTHNTSKLLFYHFNNLRLNLNKDAYKIRHTIVLDDQYALEVIDRLLEVFEGDITYLNLSGVDDNSQNNFEEIKIINDAIDNLTICKDFCSNIYAKIVATFHQYLLKIPAFLI